MGASILSSRSSSQAVNLILGRFDDIHSWYKYNQYTNLKGVSVAWLGYTSKKPQVCKNSWFFKYEKNNKSLGVIQRCF